MLWLKKKNSSSFTHLMKGLTYKITDCYDLFPFLQESKISRIEGKQVYGFTREVIFVLSFVLSTLLCDSYMALPMQDITNYGVLQLCDVVSNLRTSRPPQSIQAST